MRISVAANKRTGVADAVVRELERRGHEPVVHGALSAEERDDWAWASEAAARDVAEGRAEQGIVCCWTGTGASIAANKVHGIRAALCADAETARGARRWNDANVLALSPAHHERGAPDRDPRRLVRGSAERRRGRRSEHPPRGRDRLAAARPTRSARGRARRTNDGTEEGGLGVFRFHLATKVDPPRSGRLQCRRSPGLRAARLAWPSPRRPPARNGRTQTGPAVGPCCHRREGAGPAERLGLTAPRPHRLVVALNTGHADPRARDRAAAPLHGHVHRRRATCSIGR